MDMAKYFPKKYMVLLVHIILIMTLVSCGASATEVPAIPSATNTIENPTLTSTVPPTETLAPTATQTPFVPKATIRIAGHVPLSGDYGDWGTNLMQSAELAANQLSAPLMELGYKVEFVRYDDQFDISAAVANAKLIVADPTVLCLVGHFNSSILMQTKEIYHLAGLPLVSPSATNPKITSSAYLEVNRVVGRDEDEGIAAGQFAQSQGFSKVFIISQNNDPLLLSNYLSRELKSLGISIVANIQTDEMQNFEPFIESLLASDADLVYFNTFNFEQAGKFFRDARAAGYLGAFMGPSSLDNPSLVDLAGPLLVEGGGMYYSELMASSSDDPQAANYYKDFETLYGSTPMLFSAKAYDATGVCLAAIENASRAKDGEIPTRAEVANAIRALQDYQGITGTYTFNNVGELTEVRFFIYKVVSVDSSQWDQNILVTSIDITPPK